MTDRLLDPKRVDPQVIELYLAGASTYEVAGMLSLSQGMVCRILDVAGVPRRSGSQATLNYHRRKARNALLQRTER